MCATGAAAGATCAAGAAGLGAAGFGAGAAFGGGAAIKEVPAKAKTMTERLIIILFIFNLHNETGVSIHYL
jgi:hypothetical protein